MRANNKGSGPGPGKAKLVLVAGLFALAWLALWGRAAQLQIIRGPELEAKASRQNLTTDLLVGQRGKILDRNGQILATSVEAKSVSLRPGEVTDRDRVATLLSEVLGLDRDGLLKKLASGKNFVWVKRQIGDREAKALADADLDGVCLVDGFIRLYPQGHLAGQVLGFVGVDGVGLDGLEKAFESRLAGGQAELVVHRDGGGHKLVLNPKDHALDVDGQDVTLTLDSVVQAFAEQALSRAVRGFEARYGVALVVHVPTGEILALANYPFFNPNEFRIASNQVKRDRAALDIVEPGSTMKPLLFAAALEEGVLTPDQIIDCGLGKMKIGPDTIRDHHAYGWLTANQVLRYSSNVGAAKVGLALGAERYYDYLYRLGMGQAVDLSLPAEAEGFLHPWQQWSDFDLASQSFGQGIGVTALQLTQAFLTIAAKGVKRPLTLVRSTEVLPHPPARLFSTETAETVLDMMSEVVEMDGTARGVRIPGVVMAGKTGTAQKAEKSGGYGEDYLSSFVGVLPAEDPELLILVMIDEPGSLNAGGKVAAPVVREIAVNTLAYWGRLPDPSQVQEPEPGLDPNMVAQAEDAGQAVDQAVAQAIAIPTPEQVLRTTATMPKAGNTVPELSGLPIRRVLELLAARGIIPVIKGEGSTVVGQHPDPGEPWPSDENNAEEGAQGEDHVFVLWVS